MNHLVTKISNLIKRGYITLTNSDESSVAYCQVSYLDEKIETIESIYPYGLSANAPLNNIVLLFNVNGSESNLAGIPYSQSNRFKNLKPGEVVIGNPMAGSHIKFDENKNINLYSLGKFISNITSDIIVDCGNNYELAITGNLVINSAKLSFFGTNPVVKQSGGTLTAGGSYTTNEQDMINKMFTALKNYGLLT